MKRTMRWIGIGLLFSQGWGVAALQAQQPVSAEPQAPSGTVQAPREVVPPLPVPRLVKFAGMLKDELGKARTGVVGLTFAVYKEQEGGAALWLETQNVELDEQGRYTVLLGATKSEGLPLELFTTGESRWLGVQVQLPGEVEQPRVLLVSVPYALKASDADTVGGLPASAFVLAQPETPSTAPSSGPTGAAQGTTQKLPGAKQAATRRAGTASLPTPGPISGSGTPNQVAKFTTDNFHITDSLITDNGTFVGIGTTTPNSHLHIQGLGPDVVFNFQNAGIGGHAFRFDSTNNTSVFGGGKLVMQDLNAGGAARFTIDSNGFVGLGTASPDSHLHIQGAGPDVVFNFQNAGAGGHAFRFDSTNNASFFGGGKLVMQDLNAGGAARFTIDPNGNMGIGTSSPGALLNVVQPAQTSGSIMDVLDVTGGTGVPGFAGANINLTGGAGGSNSVSGNGGTGGSFNISAGSGGGGGGAGSFGGFGGSMNISAGGGGSGGTMAKGSPGGTVNIRGGSGGSGEFGAANGGDISLTAGDGGFTNSGPIGNGGNIFLNPGQGATPGGINGRVGVGKALMAGSVSAIPLGSEPLNTTGGGSGLSMDDRDGTSPRWVVYPNMGRLRFWTNGDHMSIDGAGNVRAGGTFTASTTPDLAETIPTDDATDVADVVCADPRHRERAVRCTRQNSAVLGVISDGSSSFLINSRASSPEASLTGKPLVLAGRVPVRVSLENGPIHIGDLLAPSSTPGVAMRATEPGPTVGIALEAFDGALGRAGQVLCFVKVGEGNTSAALARVAAENRSLRMRLAFLQSRNTQMKIHLDRLERIMTRIVAAQGNQATAMLGR